MNHQHHTRRLAWAGALVLVVAALGAPALQAQVYETEVDIQSEMKAMTKELSLTADQQAAIEPILISAAEEGEAIRAMYDDEDNDEAVEKLEKLHKSTMTQIGEVLNEDQMAKLKKMTMEAEKEQKKQAEAQEKDMD